MCPLVWCSAEHLLEHHGAGEDLVLRAEARGCRGVVSVPLHAARHYQPLQPLHEFLAEIICSHAETQAWAS